jgi:uncharacterized protein YgiM (DUF1202 family)
VHVVEEDDGSGWVKVVDEDGDRGLVPASYVESADATQVKSPDVESPRSSQSGQFGEWFQHPSATGRSYNRPSEVRGLYDYHSQGPDELNVSEGARIELTSGPSGGQNYAEGWWEGQLQQHTPVSRRSILI